MNVYACDVQRRVAVVGSKLQPLLRENRDGEIRAKRDPCCLEIRNNHISHRLSSIVCHECTVDEVSG